MQLVGRARRVIAEIFLAVGISRAPSSAEQHDRPLLNRAVALFPIGDIGDRQTIVGIGRRFRADIDDGSRRDQLAHRNLIDAERPLREMHRGIQMRAAVLGRAERVR